MWISSMKLKNKIASSPPVAYLYFYKKLLWLSLIFILRMHIINPTDKWKDCWFLRGNQCADWWTHITIPPHAAGLSGKGHRILWKKLNFWFTIKSNKAGLITCLSLLSLHSKVIEVYRKKNSSNWQEPLCLYVIYPLCLYVIYKSIISTRGLGGALAKRFQVRGLASTSSTGGEPLGQAVTWPCKPQEITGENQNPSLHFLLFYSQCKVYKQCQGLSFL